MKMNYGWFSGGHGTNSSGFSGLPVGYRHYDGYFDNAGGNGYWWSSSPNDGWAWNRNLYLNEFVYRNYVDRRYGFSVRCVRDAE